ncbi:MAG: hypothetical protein ACHQ17_02045 [Polyangia bacterium]|jgi:hypothetical protein
MSGKDEFRRQVGTVWRMAQGGLDTLREVVVRSSQAGRLRVDLALLARQKQQLLATLGAEVIALADEGSLALPATLRQLADRVREVELRIQADSGKAHDNAFGAPRGYEPEAGNYEDELDATFDDDHDESVEAASHGKGDVR